MLMPIKPKRVSDQVFEQLRDLIFKASLKPGDQLMSERELAESLGVCRPTVREAINKLVALHLLEHRQGHGTFVVEPAAEKNPLGLPHYRDLSLADLLEVKLGLECNGAIMAARRATEEDLRDMEKSLVDMESRISSGEAGSNANLAFHMAVAYATKNTAQIHITKNFYDLLSCRTKGLLFLYTEPVTLGAIVRQHRNIVRAVQARDREAAYNAMREHLTFIMDFVQGLEAPYIAAKSINRRI
jgi:GntR family transcriptional repressor for pyruvate dehydrogenase complex